MVLLWMFWLKNTACPSIMLSEKSYIRNKGPELSQHAVPAGLWPRRRTMSYILRSFFLWDWLSETEDF